MSTSSTPDASSEDASATQLDRLRLDYAQTTDLMGQITDVRFKLLALVPTLSGAAVADTVIEHCLIPSVRKSRRDPAGGVARALVDIVRVDRHIPIVVNEA